MHLTVSRADRAEFSPHVSLKRSPACNFPTKEVSSTHPMEEDTEVQRGDSGVTLASYFTLQCPRMASLSGCPILQHPNKKNKKCFPWELGVLTALGDTPRSRK